MMASDTECDKATIIIFPKEILKCLLTETPELIR